MRKKIMLLREKQLFTLVVLTGRANERLIRQSARSLGLHIDVISVESDQEFTSRANEINRVANGYGRLILWGDNSEMTLDAIKQNLIAHERVDIIILPSGWNAGVLSEKNVLDQFVLARIPELIDDEERQSKLKDQVLSIIGKHYEKKGEWPTMADIRRRSGGNTTYRITQETLSKIISVLVKANCIKDVTGVRSIRYMLLNPE